MTRYAEQVRRHGRALPTAMRAFGVAGALLWAGLGSAAEHASRDAAGASTVSDSLDAMAVLGLVSSSPAVAAARTEIRAAKGRLASAYAPAQENPSLEGLGLVRGGEGRPRWDLRVPIGVGPAWVARVQRERRDVERVRAAAASVLRSAIRDAMGAYYRALHAERRLEIARARRDVAERWFAAAGDRERAGEASRLDVGLAALERSRARSALLVTERARADAGLALAVALGLDGGAALRWRGALSDRVPVDAIAGAAGDERPDVRAAERAERAAAADQRLARLSWFPTLAFRAEREEEDSEVRTRLGAEVSLPIFQFGQGARAEAGARRERAEIELRAARRRAAAELETARAGAAAARAALGALEADEAYRPGETLSMAEEAYRAGKLDLAGLLVLRGEWLSALEEHADRQLEAAIATVEETLASGRIP